MTTTITLTGSAEDAAGEDRGRKKVTLQNISTTDNVYFNLQGVATSDTFKLLPGGAYENPPEVDVTGKISVLGTAAQKLVIMS